MIPLSLKRLQKGSLAVHTDQVVQWSLENWVQLNTEKCKEMQINLLQSSSKNLSPNIIEGDALIGSDRKCEAIGS